MCASHHNMYVEHHEPETNNDKLIRLTMDLGSHGVALDRVRELQRQIDLCQNDETVDKATWETARDAYFAANNLLIVIDRMQFIRH